jgi:methylthioribose-1-phosphate isomerase
MQVRGAPLIAIVAALGLAVDVHSKQSTFKSATEAASHICESLQYLKTSRPTAVNLFTAANDLRYIYG